MSAGEAQPLAPLSWGEIVEHSSRLHTTRQRPEGPWDDAEMREDAQVLQVVYRGLQSRVVPTRVHEPGFYVERGDELMRSDEQMVMFRQDVDAGEVYSFVPDEIPSNA